MRIRKHPHTDSNLLMQQALERMQDCDLEQEKRASDIILKKIILEDNEIINCKTKTHVDV